MQKHNHISLKPYNTFGISARAESLYDCSTTSDVQEAIAQTKSVRRYVLGGGSNVLFTSDFNGAIIRPLVCGLQIIDRTDGEYLVRVGAGVEWDRFVQWSIDSKLYGAENLSGIPGNVGAAPVQNIGAYGAEAKDIIHRVDGILMSDGSHFGLTNAECRFGYRDSIFKQEMRGKAIITHVTFRLRDEPQLKLEYGALRQALEGKTEVTAADVRAAIIATRDSKLPDPKVLGNAGSFFKNPEVSAEIAQRIRDEHPDIPSYPAAEGRVKVPAGWLIERSGWKGKALGPAAVHDRQALVLVNRGGATGADIVALCEAVRADVNKKFGILLTPEVNFVGEQG